MHARQSYLRHKDYDISSSDVSSLFALSLSCLISTGKVLLDDYTDNLYCHAYMEVGCRGLRSRLNRLYFHCSYLLVHFFAFFVLFLPRIVMNK